MRELEELMNLKFENDFNHHLIKTAKHALVDPLEDWREDKQRLTELVKWINKKYPVSE